MPPLPAIRFPVPSGLVPCEIRPYPRLPLYPTIPHFSPLVGKNLPRCPTAPQNCPVDGGNGPPHARPTVAKALVIAEYVQLGARWGGVGGTPRGGRRPVRHGDLNRTQKKGAARMGYPVAVMDLVVEPAAEAVFHPAGE